MRPRTRSLGFILGALIAAAIAGPALAGSLDPPGPPAPTMKTLLEVEPRVPVEWLPGSATAMHVITSPGSYVLTGNLVGTGDIAAIEVASDNVTIDLNGFALIAESAGAASAIDFPAEQHSIAIRNGTIKGWGAHAIRGWNCKDCQVRRILATDNSLGGGYSVIQLGESATVSECTVGNAGFTGIQVSAGSLIEDCVAVWCGQGFELSGENYTIVRSVARYNGGYGIYLQGSGSWRTRQRGEPDRDLHLEQCPRGAQHGFEQHGLRHPRGRLPQPRGRQPDQRPLRGRGEDPARARGRRAHAEPVGRERDRDRGPGRRRNLVVGNTAWATGSTTTSARRTRWARSTTSPGGGTISIAAPWANLRH